MARPAVIPKGFEVESQEPQVPEGFEVEPPGKKTPIQMQEGYTSQFLPVRRTPEGHIEPAVPGFIKSLGEALTAPGRALQSGGAADYDPRQAGPSEAEGAGVALNMLPGMMKGRPVVGPRVPVRTPAVRAAQEAGYRMTPEQLGQGVAGKSLQTLSGSAKLERNLSFKNQKVTNEHVKSDFGFPADKQVKPEDLAKVRADAGQAYEAVKSSVKLIKPDAEFRADIQALRGDYTQAAKEYPGLIKNEEVERVILELDKAASPRAMVELTKKLRSDASKNFKNYDDPGKLELAHAQKGAANALETMIDRALSSVGKKDLVRDWQSARRTIAKSYDAEAALNPETGDFSARTLAKMAKKGKPLDGGMKKAADFAQAFEASAGDVAKLRGGTGVDLGDLLLGGAGHLGLGLAGHGALGGVGLGLVLARPAARAGMASRAYQSLAKEPPTGMAVRLGDINKFGTAGLGLGLRREREDQ